METKQCNICKEIKPITEFSQNKSGKNKGYYYPYCKPCNKEYYNKNSRTRWRLQRKIYHKIYLKENPWAKTFIRILWRCNGKNQPYRKKGIKNHLTPLDLKHLWFRDKAYLLKSPSIDRINPDDDYVLENCRYIERSINVSCYRDKKLELSKQGIL